ncbi:TetR/AcrR family transcriptional regulator [Yinghuangia seranimata]|uniref:TetR/AcrR family transcriptional regulator n=1 Tax=Yinghuangia seranimata TaxID=408067 RepID=UPI00248AB6C3|nr:TetR/AcrR family transcriptional regulator [Yinghuangia seranimata]MDI2128453.1 TetR/AcrR family transcriptional regulator [Yinghuangia seranimata]
MGQKGAQTRDRLLDTTHALVQAKGYTGTGLNEVVAVSGAPRGSLYFHFPGGKDQLIAESVRYAGQAIGSDLAELSESTGPAAEFVGAVLRRLGEQLEASEWLKGCPIATVALEAAATNDLLQEACSEVYASWEAALRARLGDRPDAADLAVTVLALIEGALLLARAHRSREPLDRIGRQIAVLLS